LVIQMLGPSRLFSRARPVSGPVQRNGGGPGWLALLVIPFLLITAVTVWLRTPLRWPLIALVAAACSWSPLISSGC
jgi:hypothetical protein